MMQRIGFIVICIATMTADSDSLIVPALLLAIGITLMMIGKKGEKEWHEN